MATPDELRYPRSGVPLATRAWWQEPHHDVDSLIARLDGAGVCRAVLVQAVGLYGFDNRYLLDATARWADRLGAVVAVDVTAPHRAEDITSLAGRQEVRGVRLFAVGGGRVPVAASHAEAALRAARRAGVVVVLTALGHQLVELVPALAAHPEVPVAVDHCAFPDCSNGRLATDDPVFSLAPLEHVALKVTSHVLTEVRGAGGDPAQVVASLAERFGTHRLLWGSDYPQTDLGDYEAHLALARDALRPLGTTASTAVLGANAESLFALPARGSASQEP